MYFLDKKGDILNAISHKRGQRSKIREGQDIFRMRRRRDEW